MVADTEVNEIDIGKVTVGGPVEVRLEAYPRAIFHGNILKIGSLAKLRQSRTGNATGIKVFDVTVKIEERDSRLKPGLTATLDIIVDRQEDVISVPLPTVVSRRGEHFVFVANGGKIEERKVVLGPSNEQSIVVQKGLRPGEQLILGLPPSGPS
jgi:multidrug efflux pump subunit AcrA (membrane-fusion protein)